MQTEKALKEAEQWLLYDRNPESREQVLRLLEDKHKADARLMDHFGQRIEFGTAGLRSRMAVGSAHMNDLIIIQTAQGLLAYIKQRYSAEDLKSRGVMLGFDGRKNSHKWAMISANIFTRAGVLVHLSTGCIPTPYVAFGVRHYRTLIGIMVTASHNPKDDNGYKVYAESGAQIVSPMDKEIAAAIMKSLQPEPEAWQYETVYSNGLLHEPMPDLEQAYSKAQLDSIHFRPSELNAKPPVKIVYSAMHGVGLKPVQAILRAFGFPADFAQGVPSQCQVDCEFPTVPFPNPEEKQALNLAQAFAEQTNSPVILANDPDADRLAMAERDANSKAWHVFTGNQMGAILGYWTWTEWRKRNPKHDLAKVYLMSSVVSSKILQSIAKKEGLQFVETLTGFKWMGTRASELALLDPDVRVIFAFEEAIGFMCGSVVLDKDGVSALALTSEIVSDTYSKGSSMKQLLTEIYQKYGQHLTSNGYFISHDKMKTDAMFQYLRSWPEAKSPRVVQNGLASYPAKCGQIAITAIRDLTLGYDDDYMDKKPRLPISTSSHSITFQLQNGVWVTLRTSGTEPKIKYYSELKTEPGDASELVVLERKLQDVISGMIAEFYQPDKHGFLAQH